MNAAARQMRRRVSAPLREIIGRERDEDGFITETLVCGHRQRMIYGFGNPPAKRRRCDACEDETVSNASHRGGLPR